MKTSELDGRALDYWCARTLVWDDDEVIFNQVAPSIVVTLTHGALRKLAQPFSPAEEWADALEVLERARELQWTRGEQRSHCRVQFDNGAWSAGEGSHPRIALLRAFVGARFGESVADFPVAPHSVRNGETRAYDAGAVPPTYGDNAGANSEIGDIRSVPRP